MNWSPVTGCFTRRSGAIGFNHSLTLEGSAGNKYGSIKSMRFGMSKKKGIQVYSGTELHADLPAFNSQRLLTALAADLR